MKTDRVWLGAAEAAGLLGVSRPTLYAYVSRGYVRSQAMPGGSRERGYSREDLARLQRRSEERRHPDSVAAHALQWGMPVLESSITLIDGRTLYYRGHDALMLARSRSVAEVASLIWTGAFDGSVASDGSVSRARAAADEAGLPFVARAQRMLAAASARDPMAPDLRAASAAQAGWRILRLLTRAAAGPGAPAATIDQSLASAWGVSGRGADVLRQALILCADHELNVSSFTARCVASAGSHPYAVVIAGLAALEGPKHGGASARVESMLVSLRRARRLERTLAERLRHGEEIHGFGHPLYPIGDPRAIVLLDSLRERFGRSAELLFLLAVAEAAGATIQQRPNIDFALTAVARVLRLPAGAPLMLFAIGRSIGWIGHAIEQYAAGQLIRPRARYVGVVPAG